MPQRVTLETRLKQSLISTFISGFGVCCTFSIGCGASTAENTTYFESSTTVSTGPCTAKVCKCSSDVCQIRLDFNTFTITGPSTSTTSIGKVLNGALAEGAGTLKFFNFSNLSNLVQTCLILFKLV